jgi:pimeloyl-ACP methyl ester carboxylesterase
VESETRHLTDTELVERLRQSAVTGVFNVQTHGGELPMMVTRRKSPVLIVTFAGAIDRKTLALPQFGGKFLDTYVPASVIGLADPSLALSPDLTAAWYAGHEGFELQQFLPAFLQQIADACDAKRVIFLGSSVGGFAALYYSWRFPQSIAIVTNPQTDIDRFYLRHRTVYRAVCRPSLPDNEPLSTVITSDLVSCYAKRFDNTVIYLQSAADPTHIRNHFSPFLGAIKIDNHRRLLARLAYWGREGHKQPPAREWLAWVKAAIISPSSEAEDLQRVRKEFTSQKSEASDDLANLSDYQLAEALVERVRIQNGEAVVSSPQRSES